MVTKATTGQAATLRAMAPSVPTPASGMSTFVANAGFRIAFRGHMLEYRAAQRYVAEPALKAFIQAYAADADVTWES